MSRRTSEASKAIRAAWLKERELVSEGTGTRDWTPEQQKEIIELGKAYYHSKDPNDVNDGKAFEGHHMKNAEAYPEYQGDPENIQFLSRSEHQEAHGGDYRNPTNGYFNPVTKNTKDFGDNKYEPCEIIKLSNPIVRPSDVEQLVSEKTETPLKEEEQKSDKEQRKDKTAPKKKSTYADPKVKASPKASKSFGEKLIDTVGTVKKFSERHPVLTSALRIGGKVGLAIAGGKVIANISKESGGGSSSPSSNNSSDRSSESSFENKNADTLDMEDCEETSSGIKYPDERSSPKEHIVPGHGQHYNTRNGRIWKEKDPYPRGGKHDKE